MNISKPHLFIEINNEELIFLVVKYNENLDFQVLESVVSKSEGVEHGKITDVFLSSKIIKTQLNLIEKKIKFIFKTATVINNQENLECISVSGFKKLNGSQISNEDIFYILNNIKKLVLDSHPFKSLIHLFNSDFILDKVALKNPPIGLYGEFYNQHLTFFLLPKNEVKNIKVVLNNCGINIERIILKSFVENLEKIKQNKIEEILISIKLGKVKSNISIFYKSSFIYSENFKFGSDMIIKDISKLCSLSSNTVRKIFSTICFDDFLNIKNEEFLDKKYFKDSLFRKISIPHLNNIISARARELVEIIYKKNINLKYLNKMKKTTHLSFEDRSVYESLKETFKNILPASDLKSCTEITQDEHLKACYASAKLIGAGWEREAIPIIQTNKSSISKFFSYIFK